MMAVSLGFSPRLRAGQPRELFSLDKSEGLQPGM
jgi:hypothetical protein